MALCVKAPLQRVPFVCHPAGVPLLPWYVQRGHKVLYRLCQHPTSDVQCGKRRCSTLHPVGRPPAPSRACRVASERDCEYDVVKPLQRCKASILLKNAHLGGKSRVMFPRLQGVGAPSPSSSRAHLKVLLGRVSPRVVQIAINKHVATTQGLPADVVQDGKTVDT